MTRQSLNTQPMRDQGDVSVIDIRISCPAWHCIPDIETLCRNTIQAVLQSEQSPMECAVSLLLADDLFIAGLNQQYRGQKKPTNVLSFPARDKHLCIHSPDQCLGDVVLARETVFGEAREQGKKPEDHMCHLIVHGVLHLLGQDHETEDAAERMENTECRILKSLGIDDPYRTGWQQPQPVTTTGAA